MARYDLKFIDSYDNTISVKNDLMTYYDDSDKIVGTELQVRICIDYGKGENLSVFLDKSTAIKLAKTLRTEINKITESEV